MSFTVLTTEYIPYTETEGTGEGVWRVRREENTAPKDALWVYIRRFRRERFREEGFDFSRSFGHCAFVRAHITTTWLAFAALICSLRAHTTGLSSHSALSSGAHPNWRGRDTVIAIWPAIMLELLSEVYFVYNPLA